ncbi:MAG: hypothetical protein MJ070_08380 [Lachnospiraceae bacterium]|nr:hypothetical protein [Lachnospiraceae bacterium]
MKNSFPKRFLAAALLAVTVLAALTACVTVGPNEGDTSEITQGATEEVTKSYKPKNVPDDLNYDGREFTVMTFGETTVVWFDVDWSAVEETAEDINDGVYRRTARVESELGIKVVPELGGVKGSGEPLKKSVLANDSLYDIAFINVRSAGALSQEECLYDLHDLDQLEIEAEWWDQNCVKDMSIYNMLFMLTGDIEIMYKKSIGVTLFNKVMAKDYQLPDLYELVDDKEWTIYKIAEYGFDVSEDINNDDKWTKDDTYGYLFYSDVSALGVIAAEASFCEKNEDDLPEITFFSDRTVEALDAWFEVLLNGTLSYSDNNENVLKPMFINGQALFDYNEFHAVEQLRQMETDFGILPIPMLDEDQEGYHHSINPHVGSVMVVPYDNDDLEFTAWVTDSLGAASKNILTPKYYDAYLKWKSTRDDESKDVIDLILATIRYDLGYMYDYGGLSDLTLRMTQSKKTNVASEYTKIESAAQDALEKAIDKYFALDF